MSTDYRLDIQEENKAIKEDSVLEELYTSINDIYNQYNFPIYIHIDINTDITHKKY